MVVSTVLIAGEVSHEHMPAGAGWEPSKRVFAR